MSEIRPRRSALYLPASNAKALEKARSLDCDVVILDLEDSVAPEMKKLARDRAVEAVRSGGFGRRELVVRANGLGTPWGGDDLRALVLAAPDAILVPKADSGADIHRYDEALGAAPGRVQLWAMIETAKSLFRLEEIASASATSRLSLLVMGTNDLAKEMRATLTVARAALLGPLSLSVAAAATHGLAILDGVFNDIEDDEGFDAQLQQGLEFGFDGKTLIHPRQIARCNEVFTPSPEKVSWARAVIAAFELPESAGKGAIRVDGKMVERLHLTQAQQVLVILAALPAEAPHNGTSQPESAVP
jgi:citrate lyase subunit beta/citryl-CoA lyase